MIKVRPGKEPVSHHFKKNIAERLYISRLVDALALAFALLCVYAAKATPLRFRGKANNMPKEFDKNHISSKLGEIFYAQIAQPE